jgi:hypothetical protein
MKTIYALIAACLALQACNSQSGTPPASVNIDEHSALSEYMAVASLRDAEHTAVLSGPAITAFDDYSFAASGAVQLTDDEYVATTSAIPAIKPIDGAEFEGTSRDDTDAAWSTVYYLVDYNSTATVIPKIERNAPGFYSSDEDGGLSFETTPATEEIRLP